MCVCLGRCTCAPVYVYVCACKHIYTHMRTYMHTSAHDHTHSCLHIHLHVCVYMFLHEHEYARICACAHMFRHACCYSLAFTRIYQYSRVSYINTHVSYCIYACARMFQTGTTAVPFEYPFFRYARRSHRLSFSVCRCRRTRARRKPPRRKPRLLPWVCRLLCRVQATVA